MVPHLTLLQINPTKAVAPSADLVAWSRLGSRYASLELENALQGRALLELLGMIRPSEDLALYRAEMADWPGRGTLRGWRRYVSDWVRANDACRLDVLDRLGSHGPLSSRELPDTRTVPWGSIPMTRWSPRRRRYGDLLIGKLDATADRKAGVPVVDAIHRDVPFDATVTAAVDEEIKDLARWLELELALPVA